MGFCRLFRRQENEVFGRMQRCLNGAPEIGCDAETGGIAEDTNHPPPIPRLRETLQRRLQEPYEIAVRSMAIRDECFVFGGLGIAFASHCGFHFAVNSWFDILLKSGSFLRLMISEVVTPAESFRSPRAPYRISIWTYFLSLPFFRRQWRAVVFFEF